MIILFTWPSPCLIAPRRFQNHEFQHNTPVKGPGPKRGQKLLEFFAATTAGCETLLLPNSFQTAAPRCGQVLYPALSAYPSDSSWVTACDNAKSTPHPVVVLKFHLALPPMATKSYGSGWWHGSRSHDSHRDKGIDPLPPKKWPSICRPSPNRPLTCGMSQDSPVKMNKDTPSQITKWRLKKLRNIPWRQSIMVFALYLVFFWQYVTASCTHGEPASQLLMWNEAKPVSLFQPFWSDHMQRNWLQMQTICQK